MVTENKYIDLEIEKDIKAIPFKEVIRLANAFKRKDGKPDNKRMAILWLALTGARPCEIENRTTSEIVFNKYWVWKPRKKQKGTRREKLEDWFWEEFNEYLLKGKYSNKDIFGIKGNSLARYINKNIRPTLDGDWLKKKPEFKEDGTYRLIYIWQLKHLRHNFQTLEWFREKDKYGKDLALMRLSRRMKHSSKHITGCHYIETVEALNLNKYKHQSMGEILKITNNRNLLEFA